MRVNDRLYALYEGNNFVCIGNVVEIANETGRAVETVRWMTTKTGLESIAKREMRGTCPTKLVPIIDEDQPLMKLDLSDAAIDILSDKCIMTVGDLVELTDSEFEQLSGRKSIKMEIASYRDWYLGILRAEYEEDLKITS